MSTPQNQVFLGTTQTNVITVNSPGPQGPTGPMGNPGPTGPATGVTGPTGPPGPTSAPLYNNEIAAVAPSGVTDNFSPFGYVPGTTNVLILTPTDNTSALAGLSAFGVPDGFSLLILNASATLSMSLLSQSSGSPANQFTNADDETLALPFLSAVLLVYFAAVGWQVIGVGGTGGSTGVAYSEAISATLASGTTDLGAVPPAGFVSNVTNQLTLTPNSSGSTLSGLLAPTTNGFSILLVNASATVPIIFAHQSASLPANQFNCIGGVAIGPLAAAIVSYVTGSGWFFT